MEGLAVPFEAITQGLNSIKEFFISLLDYLNPFSENFILYKVISFLGNIISYLNPFDDNFLLKGVLDFFAEIISYINPFSENFFVYKLIDLLKELLVFLFVPDTNPFEEISVKINEKFVFVSQIQELFSSLLGFDNYGDSVPTFNITWYGVTVAIIDFSLFLDYRTWLHGIILAIAWFIFIRKTFNKLPAIIGGFNA